MIISNKDADARINNPMNLINQIKNRNGNRSNAMNLFGINRQVKKEEVAEVKISFNPFSHNVGTESQKENLTSSSSSLVIAVPEIIEQTIDDLVTDNDQQVKLALAHDSALQVLTDSVSMLAAKLDDIKAEKLPSVITATSKVVESIRRERNESSKNGKDREVHYHFYTPVQRKLEQYEIIEVAS